MIQNYQKSVVKSIVFLRRFRIRVWHQGGIRKYLFKWKRVLVNYGGRGCRQGHWVTGVQGSTDCPCHSLSLCSMQVSAFQNGSQSVVFKLLGFLRWLSLLFLRQIQLYNNTNLFTLFYCVDIGLGANTKIIKTAGASSEVRADWLSLLSSPHCEE